MSGVADSGHVEVRRNRYGWAWTCPVWREASRSGFTTGSHYLSHGELHESLPEAHTAATKHVSRCGRLLEGSRENA